RWPCSSAVTKGTQADRPSPPKPRLGHRGPITTVFSRSIPFGISRFPFSAFFPAILHAAVDVSLNRASLSRVFSIHCQFAFEPQLRRARMATYVQQKNWMAGHFPHGHESLQPLAGDAAGRSYGRAGAVG